MSIIYELALVEDRGAYWQVTNVTKNTLDNLANRDEKMLKLSYNAYQKIKDAILEGNIVTIPKSLRTDEVSPSDVMIAEVGKTDHLRSTRNAAITKIRMLVTPELAKISGFALYGFTVLNNDMIAAGFAITNNNREEKYLEILETGDEELISKLEDYLNYKDEIERIASLERNFAQAQRSINNADEEDIEGIVASFLEDFYKNF